MPKLRRMSGAQVIAIFQQFGFTVHSRKSSHVKLRRILPAGETQTLVVPDHREIDTGTLRAILRQAARYVPLEELCPLFYA